jgi:hypothetical protein
VPLEAKDVPPGSAFRWDKWNAGDFCMISAVTTMGFYTYALGPLAAFVSFEDAASHKSYIKRPGEDWKPCYKEI